MTKMESNNTGVYKLGYDGKSYYRVGRGAENARVRLACELKVPLVEIEILDGGRKQ